MTNKRSDSVTILSNLIERPSKNTGLLPNFYMIFDKLGGAEVFTIIDMVAEYWQ